MSKVFIAVLVGTIVLLVVFQFIDPTSSTNIINGANTELVSGATSSISVTISGEITREGTYLMEPGSTLYSLIETASGVTSNADPLAYDTTYVMNDGDTFYIAPKYNNNDVCTMEEIAKVNINLDNSETLQTVSGIGYTVANAIVKYRETNGAYKRIEEVKNVSGIGNATFEKIKNYIRLRNE